MVLASDPAAERRALVALAVARIEAIGHGGDPHFVPKLEGGSQPDGGIVLSGPAADSLIEELLLLRKAAGGVSAAMDRALGQLTDPGQHFSEVFPDLRRSS